MRVLLLVLVTMTACDPDAAVAPDGGPPPADAAPAPLRRVQLTGEFRGVLGNCFVTQPDRLRVALWLSPERAVIEGRPEAPCERPWLTADEVIVRCQVRAYVYPFWHWDRWTVVLRRDQTYYPGRLYWTKEDGGLNCDHVWEAWIVEGELP